MATFTNRSRHYVSVKRRAGAKREFSYDRDEDAREYLRKLRAQGLHADIRQYEDNIEVRIRDVGYRSPSYEEAERRENRGSAGRTLLTAPRR